MLSTTRNLPADFHTGDEPTITDRLLLSRNLFPFIREEIGFDEMLIEISKSLFFKRDICREKSAREYRVEWRERSVTRGKAGSNHL